MNRHTVAGLTDIRQRSQWSFQKLLDHCDGFSLEELRRELAGFGYPSILLQLHHVIGAEQYWVGVLRGQMLIDEHEGDRSSIAALRDYCERVTRETLSYLGTCSDEEVNTRSEYVTWGDRRVELAPAHVLLRTQMHVFQHQGQVAAMCRLLGRPLPAGLDFPLGAALAGV